MADIHELIIREGVEAARAQAKTKHERLLVEIAAEVLSEENERMGFTHSGFCMTALPHSKLIDPNSKTERNTWRREGHKVTLVVQSGVNKDGDPVGIPYGSRARMILLYLQTSAIRTDNSVVALGSSMRHWMEHSMGMSIGGKTYNLVREQANRISACRLAFFSENEEASGRLNGGFVRSAIEFKRPTDPAQGELWQETVELDPDFFGALKQHPVPLWEPALRLISGKSLAIDLYIWLAYRLHNLKKSVSISWPSLYAQFGGSYKTQRQFKPEFITNLQMAVAAYPEAHVDIDQKTGLMLWPSPSPIPSNVHALPLRR